MAKDAFVGQEPGVEREPPPHPRHGPHSELFCYRNADGSPRFYVCRYDLREGGKTFLQGHWTDAGKWVWNLKGVTPCLYRLPELHAHLSSGAKGPVYVPEGEKGVRLTLGLLERDRLPGVATCNPMGAGKWRDEYTEALTGARLVIFIADNDDQGRAHALKAARELEPHVGEVRVMRGLGQEAHDDIEEHIEQGGSLDTLVPLELPASSDGPLFMDVHDFVRQQVDAPRPLWGTDKLTILAEAGLGVFAGRPASGKTTFVLDAACHFAAGIDYPPAASDDNGRAPASWPVERPLRVAIIENEGPREMFRAKLQHKLAVFPHDIRAKGGYLGIQVWRWGAFSFADNDAFARAEAELDALGIDLVIGDPLNMLGVKGVGSPEDTREFVQRLRLLGLGTRRAFLLIHHFRERADKQDDELSRISGAWGGHLDSLITLSNTANPKEARLAYPKLRWAREEPPKAQVLGRVYNTAGFELLGEEDDAALLEPAIAEALQALRDSSGGTGGKGWATYSGLASQIGKRKKDVLRCLEGAPHIFTLRTGEDAKAVGARVRSAKLWGLKAWDDAPPEAAPATHDAQEAFNDDDIPW